MTAMIILINLKNINSFIIKNTATEFVAVNIKLIYRKLFVF